MYFKKQAFKPAFFIHVTCICIEIELPLRRTLHHLVRYSVRNFNPKLPFYFTVIHKHKLPVQTTA